jgi:uncharacterized protein DUF4231
MIAPEVSSLERRPPPVLAIGISGQSDLAITGPTADLVTARLNDLFARLAIALKTAIASEADFFAPTTPTMRLVSLSASGAGSFAIRAARAHGDEVGYVLPFPLAEYRHDFSSEEEFGAFKADIAGAGSAFVLPGTHCEGARAYERAYEVILANVDILVAVWDGERAKGAGSTGDVVQATAARGLPVIVIPPDEAVAPYLLTRPDENMLAAPTDLVATPLVLDLTDILAAQLLPPHGTTKRQGLLDFMSEAPSQHNLRHEYSILLRAFGATGPRPPNPPPNRGAETPELASRFSAIEPLVGWIDELANHYALRYRSSVTSEFLIIIISAFVAALVMLTFPNITGSSVFAQTAIGALVIIDVAVRSKQRWQERWLDYRLIAERLRCLRFLHPLGRTLSFASPFARGPGLTWVDWYFRRFERALGVHGAEMTSACVDAAWRQLSDFDIPGQIAYHRRAFMRFNILERRMSALATVAFVLTGAVALAFAIWAYHKGGFAAVEWRAYPIILLFVLPAAVSAFNGFRADADLVRLVERAAATSTALGRLRRAVRAGTPNYDRVAIASERLAAIMAGELSEWRFVLESRRKRAGHRYAFGRARFRTRVARRLANSPLGWLLPSRARSDPSS